MEVIRGLSAARKRFAEIDKTVIAVGIFDGVHLGHQQAIKTTCRCARDMQAHSLVLTFSCHPEKMLGSDKAPPLITSTEHKLKLIENLGIDFCFIPDFNRELSSLEPHEFIRDILVNILKVRGICVGHDFVFGKNRTGNVNLLKRLPHDLDLKVVLIESVKIKNKIVSSSLIRRMIVQGDLEEAGRFLGRPVSILGTVIKGNSRGRALSYPTANINPHHEVIPPAGVYCVWIRHKDKSYKGILNIGICPTFNVNENRIEVHLFDFNKDIYGKALEIIFIKKIRLEMKFRSADDLARQLKTDETIARKILS